VSRTQKQFEWLVDIIRDLEYKDRKAIISCHIFITQFFEKFDLRTIFLYICERHYQRVSNRSLFTNLKAVTHFGRPNFERFFSTVDSLHENVRGSHLLGQIKLQLHIYRSIPLGCSAAAHLR
jgi:dual oxidase